MNINPQKNMLIRFGFRPKKFKHTVNSYGEIVRNPNKRFSKNLRISKKSKKYFKY